MAKGITQSIRLEGADELEEILRELAPKEARNLLRATVHGIAGEVRDRIKQRVRRRTGKLARSIRAERRKMDGNMPVSDVVVETGKDGAFYWHFEEFGTVKQAPHPVIVPTIEEARGQMPEVMRKEFGEKYEKALARKRKAGK